MTRISILILTVFMCTQALAELVCTTDGTPPCPGHGYSTNKICRSPCAGGYKYQFGSTCTASQEVVDGNCTALPDESGNYFDMNYPQRQSFTLPFGCGVAPSPSGETVIPGQNIEFTLVATDSTEYTLESPAWRRIMATAGTSSIDYFPCLRSVLAEMTMHLEQQCINLNNRDPRVLAKKRFISCDHFAELLTGQEQYKIADIGVKAMERAARPPLLAMYPFSPGTAVAQSTEDNLKNCQDLDSLTAQEKIYALSEDFLNNKLPAIIATTRASCREYILQDYLRYFSQMQLPKEQCPGTGAPAVCHQIQTATDTGLNALQHAFDGHELKWTPFRFTNQVLQCVQASPDPASTLLFLAETVKASNSCLKLGNGEQAVFDMSETVTTIQDGDQSYLLSREGNKYRVGLNLSFNLDEDVSSTVDIRAKVNACLARANPNLFRGSDGQALEIYLIDPSTFPPDDSNLPEAVDVNIHKEYPREDSGNWSETTECEVMTHEILHLLGLVDSYPESAMGYTYDPRSDELNYDEDSGMTKICDCRSIGPADDIMRNQWAAFEKVKKNPHASMLYPAQFRAITQPGCMSANRLYYLCGMDSYSTSRAVYEDGCMLGKPDECKTKDGTWLR